MSRPGDWFCSSCQHMNFTWRDTCQICGDLRDCGGSVATMTGVSGFRGTGVLPGDWYCKSGKCDAHNYANRLNCFRCGSTRDENDINRIVGHSGWKLGDWVCARSGCNEHNFASRNVCFKCNTPKKQ